MDVSKLPKLSDTKSQIPEPATETPVPQAPVSMNYASRPYQPAGVGADIWISLVVGILLCMLGGTFGKFCIAKLTHQPFHSNMFWPDNDPQGRGGQEVDYFDVQGSQAWSDMGIFLFGVILLFEAASKTALVLRPGKPARAVLMLATLLTVLGVLLNLIACFKLYSGGTIPLISGLAVAFGGWILSEEWNTLKRTTPPI
jgi:hypothetical protein